MRFHEAVEAVVLLCSRGNQFLDEVKPWAALKNVRVEGERTVPLFYVCQVREDCPPFPPPTHTSGHQQYSMWGHASGVNEPAPPSHLPFPPLQGSDEEKRVAAVALCTVLELLRVAAVALSPITPALSQRVYLQLGYTDQQYKVWHSGCCIFAAALLLIFSPCMSVLMHMRIQIHSSYSDDRARRP